MTSQKTFNAFFSQNVIFRLYTMLKGNLHFISRGHGISETSLEIIDGYMTCDMFLLPNTIQPWFYFFENYFSTELVSRIRSNLENQGLITSLRQTSSGIRTVSLFQYGIHFFLNTYSIRIDQAYRSIDILTFIRWYKTVKRHGSIVGIFIINYE